MSSSSKTDRDYYDVLGADVSTSARDLERLYKRQASRCHPDKGGSEEAMKSLNEAYGVLKDRNARRVYDANRLRPTTRQYVAVTQPSAPDLGAFGFFLRAFLCLLVGSFLLMLVRFQWIWFLWPLGILAIFVLLFGVFMMRSALKLSLPVGNILHRHQFIQEALFWGLVLGGCSAMYLVLTALD